MDIHKLYKQVHEEETDRKTKTTTAVNKFLDSIESSILEAIRAKKTEIPISNLVTTKQKEFSDLTTTYNIEEIKSIFYSKDLTLEYVNASHAGYWKISWKPRAIRDPNLIPRKIDDDRTWDATDYYNK